MEADAPEIHRTLGLSRLSVVTCLSLISSIAMACWAVSDMGSRPVTGRGMSIDIGRPINAASLVIVTRSGCAASGASLPFYRRLKGLPVVWVAAGETVEINRRYLTRAGILPEVVVSIEKSGLSVNATPTIFAVDSDGSVRRIWIGGLTRKEEVNVISHVSYARAIAHLLIPQGRR